MVVNDGDESMAQSVTTRRDFEDSGVLFVSSSFRCGKCESSLATQIAPPISQGRY